MSTIQQLERMSAARIRDDQRIRAASPAMLAALKYVEAEVLAGREFDLAPVTAAIKQSEG